uniref:Uncharacterized protein n=1 Tax=Arundo donax TaxID=35708 RepID=A0A0A9G1L8_ARUDO
MVLSLSCMLSSSPNLVGC